MTLDLDAFRQHVSAFFGEDMTENVDTLNKLRSVLAEFSPFQSEPVDFVEWVPNTSVVGNGYNPNSVAPPEMELLRLSIMADGYTQPIVGMRTEAGHEVVDGFHRHRVGKESEDVQARVHGFLPIVSIREDREGHNDRVAATIRHNRARGKHAVTKMSDIVLDLSRRNWSDAKISKELGMDADEVLRLKQVTGIAEAFKDRGFSKSWEVIADDVEDDLDDAVLAAAGIDGSDEVTA